LTWSYLLYFAFLSSGETCAKVVGIESIGALGKDNGYTLEYYIEGEKYIGGKSKGFFKPNYSLESLKKMECIKIEYSKLTPSIFVVIDERVLAE